MSSLVAAARKAERRLADQSAQIAKLHALLSAKDAEIGQLRRALRRITAAQAGALALLEQHQSETFKNASGSDEAFTTTGDDDPSDNATGDDDNSADFATATTPPAPSTASDDDNSATCATATTPPAPSTPSAPRTASTDFNTATVPLEETPPLRQPPPRLPTPVRRRLESP